MRILDIMTQIFFSVITNDYIDLKVEYELPFILIRDWNARTKLLTDFLSDNDVLLRELGLDADVHDSFNAQNKLKTMQIETKRYNKDQHSNNNGYKLLELCKTTDVHIVNGRIGQDKGVGNLTCDDASCVDYALLSTEIFSKATVFVCAPLINVSQISIHQ